MQQPSQSVQVEVKSGHRVTIPKWFRRKHDIREGDSVYIVSTDTYRRDEVPDEEIEELQERFQKLLDSKQDSR